MRLLAALCMLRHPPVCCSVRCPQRRGIYAHNCAEDSARYSSCAGDSAHYSPPWEELARGTRTDAHFLFDYFEKRLVACFGSLELRFTWELGIGIWSLRLDK